MNNKNYIILYGIYSAVNGISVEHFKQTYKNRPFELLEATSCWYINKKGEIDAKRDYENISKGSVGNDYIAIIIRNNQKVFNTSIISNNIARLFKDKVIKNKREELKYLVNHCINNGYSLFCFPASYKNIDKELLTKRIVKPTTYIIANTNIIIDVAVGKNDITEMIKKYNNKKQYI